MNNIIYITLEQAKNIHIRTIQNSGGGNYGIVNINALEGVLTNIQNDNYYPTLEDKLTHLFFCTCNFHAFSDGNKRLAITLCAQFLLLNGYMAVAKNFFTIMENISRYVASGKINKELLHEIIVSVVSGTYDTDESIKLEIYKAISQ